MYLKNCCAYLKLNKNDKFYALQLILLFFFNFNQIISYIIQLVSNADFIIFTQFFSNFLKTSRTTKFPVYWNNSMKFLI